VTGACLSDFGNSVVCLDTDKAKIDRLSAGHVALYEPGLGDVVTRNLSAERLRFTTDSAEAISSAEVIFIAVGTPPADDGSADLAQVEAAARTVGSLIDGYRVIVDKSTVPVGTGERVHGWIAEELVRRSAEAEFDVVSNPEFLREGSAVYDFMHPDRVVIGTESTRAAESMKAIYRTLYLNETPFVFTNVRTAEMIKYAANSFLAMKITYMNEIANLCDEVGADARDVANAIGRDGRIGAKFLHPGPGYGGSCFPKDTKALSALAARHGSPVTIIDAVISANERQKERMVGKITSALGDLRGRTLAVLGLAFKQNTSDMRESPAISIIRLLVERGARIKAYDPAAMEEAQWRFADVDTHITYCLSEYDALKESDAMIILTEWNQFRNLDLGRAKNLLKKPHVFDFRNIYERDQVEGLGFGYACVGR
jgi:UDPglucose 6-dehydrogenase